MSSNEKSKKQCVLGVIIARAGSAGLPNKHMLSLRGKPVIEYTFDHARAARSVDRIVVSTDSADVRKLAEKTFLETIARPAELATADASVQDVLLHALKTVESRGNGQIHVDAIVLLYGNVPVRGENVIDRAVEMLRTTGCDSVRSFCPVGKWHPAWMAKIEDGSSAKVDPLQPGSIHRRQDLSPLFLHDGAVVAITRESLMRGEKTPSDPHAFFGGDRRAVLTDIGETIEIDHRRDLYCADAALADVDQTSADVGRVRMAS